MTQDKTQPAAGDRVRVTLGVEDEEPLYQAELMVDEASAPRAGAERQGEPKFQTRLVKEGWSSPQTKAFHVPEALAGRSVADGLKVAEFAWKFIKDNKPVARGKGTITSVVAAGSTPLDYTGARDGASRTMVLSVHDSLIKSLEYIKVKFRLEGAYAGRPAKEGIPNGQYLPSVYFNVLSCSATWPTWVEAFAEVAGPYDPGTPASRTPELKVYGKFSYGWVGSANNLTCGFLANGARGFSDRGWQSRVAPEAPMPGV